MQYRPEIDGLRAIAVLPVIFFHAGLPLFAGGFVGVDVFFVISGYLISSIILIDLEKNTFSIKRFYERRARRIFPALFAVVLISIPFAFYLLPHKELLDFGQSVFSVAVFMSNFLFWHESGYFDSSAEIKPLLHTWSLAVEEQYYVVFPLFLALAWRHGLNFIWRVLILVWSISFIFSVWATLSGLSVHPKLPSASFYLFPMRAWELLSGALLAIFISRSKEVSSSVRAGVLGCTGMFLIFVSITLFDESTPWPSFYTLLPVTGTLLVLAYTRDSDFVGKVLTARPMVAVGLISYSLYLWHQPIFAFARQLEGMTLELGTVLFLVALTFAMSSLSYRYVEKPFRQPRTVSLNYLIILTAAMVTALLTYGVVNQITAGFKSESEVTIKTLDQPKVTGLKRVMLLGDSHAQHLKPGLNELLHVDIIDNTGPGCLPLFNVDRYDHRFNPGDCVNLISEGFDRFFSDPTIDTLIISSMGPVYLDNKVFRNGDLDRVIGSEVVLSSMPHLKDRWKIYELALSDTFSRLSKLHNKNILFVIDNPELGIKPRFCQSNMRRDLFGLSLSFKINSDQNVELRCSIPREEYDNRVSRYKELVAKALANYPKIRVVDPTKVFCDEAACRGYYRVNNEFIPLYADYDHLSVVGSLLVSQVILEGLTSAPR